jgi:hypothetical protein
MTDLDFGCRCAGAAPAWLNGDGRVPDRLHPRLEETPTTMGNCLPTGFGPRRPAAAGEPAPPAQGQVPPAAHPHPLGEPRAMGHLGAALQPEGRAPRRPPPQTPQGQAAQGVARFGAAPARPLSPLTESERTHPTVQAGVRRWLASTAARPMIESTAFKPIREHLDVVPPGAAKTGLARPSGADVIEKLCDHNFDLLNKQLGPLSTQEKAFLKAFKEAPWHLTHATKHEPARTDELHLKSQAKLNANKQSAGPTLNAIDVGLYGNDHYVYFALEAGEDLQKQRSRFGDHLYRLPLQGSGVEEHGLLALHDFAMPQTTGHKHYKDPASTDAFETAPQFDHVLQFWKGSGLDDPGDHVPAAAVDPLPAEGKTLSTDVPDRCFFRASQAVEALGKSVLLSARMLGEDLRSQVLSTEPGNINTAANGIFRPQILMPHEFVTSQAERHEITKAMPFDM